jgi:secreted trypsin-like serine protease
MSRSFLILRLCVISLFFLSSCGGGSSKSADNVVRLEEICRSRGKIINGTQCSTDNSPIALIYMKNQEDKLASICSGAVISRVHVLTAAHCFTSFNATIAEVVIDGNRISGKNIFVHPRADTEGNGSNDVAIVELSQEVDVPSLPLLISREVAPQSSTRIIGYGIDENVDSALTVGSQDSLKSGTMNVSNVTEVTIETSPIETDDARGSTVCYGDSGSPLIVTNFDNTVAIAGVASRAKRANDGVLCGSASGAIFSNIQHQETLDFITSLVPGVKAL